MTTLFHDLTAVVLAGGQSSRMGGDKALLPINGVPLIRVLVDRLRNLTDEIYVSANTSESYAFLGIPVVAAVYPRCGPLAGLHAAMLRSHRSLILTLACDIPDVPLPLLGRLVQEGSGADAVVPVSSDGHIHPVCAVYNRSCLPAIERKLQSGEYKMLRLFAEPGLRVKKLSMSQFHFPDSDLKDLDSIDDFETFLRRHKM